MARGICLSDENGFLTSVTERTRIEKYVGGIHYTEDDGLNWTHVADETIVSMNLWGFTPSFLGEIESRFPAFLDKVLGKNPGKAEFFLPSSVSELIEENKATVRVLHSPDKWYGVTYAADKPVVMAALKEKTDNGFYPDGLWEG